MLYRVSWIKTTPNNRADGITYLQTVAQSIKNNYKLNSCVFVSDTLGPFYQIGLVIAYKNIGELYQDRDALDSTLEGHSKLIPSTGLFDWESPKWSTLRELKSIGDDYPAFVNIISINIKPGQIEAGSEQMVQLAKQYETSYQRPMGVLSNETGDYHQYHWTIGYDDLEQYEADVQKNVSWGQLTQSLGNVLDLASLKRDIGQFL